MEDKKAKGFQQRQKRPKKIRVSIKRLQKESSILSNLSSYS